MVLERTVQYTWRTEPVSAQMPCKFEALPLICMALSWKSHTYRLNSSLWYTRFPIQITNDRLKQCQYEQWELWDMDQGTCFTLCKLPEENHREVTFTYSLPWIKLTNMPKPHPAIWKVGLPASSALKVTLPLVAETADWPSLPRHHQWTPGNFFPPHQKPKKGHKEKLNSYPMPTDLWGYPSSPL